jgi:hypothetical protein
LQQAFNQKVNESQGLVNQADVRVSIPFIANMRPALGSEFSDPILLSTLTQIAYMASHLTPMQVSKFIKRCHKIANLEFKQLQDEGILSTETEILRKFQTAFHRSLNSINPASSTDIGELLTALTPSPTNILSDTALELVLDYVIHEEIARVEIYTRQTSSNGQNTLSMGQSSVGYSASIDNPNMTPVGTELQLEKGTNGQTADLLIRQNTEVILIGKEPADIFTDLINLYVLKHLIRAIIDVGAHFRGVSNETVAELICNNIPLMNSKAKGVLFFSTETGSLCYMDIKTPDTIAVLSGTNRETILEETGYDSTQLFTYYDQEHITGIDIAQAPDAIAILTISASTKQHEMFQGGRRCRELDAGQRLIAALAKSAVGHVNATLGYPEESNRQINIKDVILFTKIQSTIPLKEENLIFALQKISNEAEQFVLDRFYTLSFKERMAIFNTIAKLFDKDNVMDLYREYAFRRQQIPMESYLHNILEGLISLLNESFPPAEIERLKIKIHTHILNEAVIMGLNTTQSICNSEQKEKTHAIADRQREGTQMHHREQMQEQLQEEQTIEEYLRQVENRRDAIYVGVRDEVFYGIALFAPELTANISAQLDVEHPWQIMNEAITLGYPETPFNRLFYPDLIVSKNAAGFTSDYNALLGPNRTKPWPLLLIVDERDKHKEYKLVVSTLEDMRNYHMALEFESHKLPRQRQLWMVTAQGQIFFGNRVTGKRMLEDPYVCRLMVQAQFFSGEYMTISKTPWYEHLQRWFEEMPQEARMEAISFFENEILMGIPPDYKLCRLWNFFHPSKE